LTRAIVCTRRRGREKLGQTRSRQSCLIGGLYEPNAMNVCVRISRNRRLVAAIDSQIAYFRQEVTTFFIRVLFFFPPTVVLYFSRTSLDAPDQLAMHATPAFCRSRIRFAVTKILMKRKMYPLDRIDSYRRRHKTIIT